LNETIEYVESTNISDKHNNILLSSQSNSTLADQNDCISIPDKNGDVISQIKSIAQDIYVADGLETIIIGNDKNGDGISQIKSIVQDIYVADGLETILIGKNKSIDNVEFKHSPVARRTRSSLISNVGLTKGKEDNIFKNNLESNNVIDKKISMKIVGNPKSKSIASSSKGRITAPSTRSKANTFKIIQDTATLLKKRNPALTGGVKKRATKKMELTQPRPFKLTQAKTRFQPQDQEVASPYIPLANRIISFEKDTPDRFKTKAKVKFT
jgi:hypothetical protein